MGLRFRAQITWHRQQEWVAAIGSTTRGANPKNLTVAWEDGLATIWIPMLADIGWPWAQ